MYNCVLAAAFIGTGRAMVKTWALVLSLWSLSSFTCQVFAQKPASIEKVTIAQFGHVFLYLPIYVALQNGYFKEQGLDVHLVSTGGDEKTFAAVSSGNAQFGVSDPTFVAVAREKGQNGKVVASIVNGTPFWVVTFNNKLSKINSPTEFINHRIATYAAPSTSYAVMKNILQNDGHPVNAKIVQGAYGTLLPMVMADRADMALEIEPVVSIATHKGGHIVYSPASKFGDFAFTGLMVSSDFAKNHAEQVQAAVNAVAKAMTFIRGNFADTAKIAKKEFPDVADEVINESLKRLIDQGSIPKSPLMSKQSWDKAVSMRRQLGDLSSAASFDENVDMKFVNKLPRK